jgi:hypothetical protein
VVRCFVDIATFEDVELFEGGGVWVWRKRRKKCC